MLAGQVEQGGDCLFQRLAAAGDSRMSISVMEGQEIKAGEPLAIVEAMKMENILRAERDAVIRKVHVKKGDSLAVDAVIMEFA